MVDSLLAEGERAAAMVGRGSAEFIMHVRGLETAICRSFRAGRQGQQDRGDARPLPHPVRLALRRYLFCDPADNRPLVVQGG
jgi:hypothetical protein